MKVKDLIEVLSGFNPDAEVVESAGDHAYRRVRGARADQAEKSGSGRLAEFYGVQVSAPASIVDVVVLA
jgi:hypothetical protein